MILFPSVEEALALYQLLIKRFGGMNGVRDVGLLESALFRPQTGYYNDLPEMASALMESLTINHPFVDGNKRMAFFMTDVFLRMNGLKIKISTKAGQRFIIKMISSDKDRFKLIDGWLRKHTVKLAV